MPNLEQPRLVTGHATHSSGRGDMNIAVIAHGPYSPGNAQNHYVVGVGDDLDIISGSSHVVGCISFQDGNPKEVGPNGVTLEAVLACCEDRLQRFQDGPFANDYNAAAEYHIGMAIESLKDRTRERDGGAK